MNIDTIDSPSTNITIVIDFNFLKNNIINTKTYFPYILDYTIKQFVEKGYSNILVTDILVFRSTMEKMSSILSTGYTEMLYQIEQCAALFPNVVITQKITASIKNIEHPGRHKENNVDSLLVYTCRDHIKNTTPDIMLYFIGDKHFISLCNFHKRSYLTDYFLMSHTLYRMFTQKIKGIPTNTFNFLFKKTHNLQISHTINDQSGYVLSPMIIDDEKPENQKHHVYFSSPGNVSAGQYISGNFQYSFHKKINKYIWNFIIK